jgi:hypothetical protein
VACCQRMSSAYAAVQAVSTLCRCYSVRLCDSLSGEKSGTESHLERAAALEMGAPKEERCRIVEISLRKSQGPRQGCG